MSSTKTIRRIRSGAAAAVLTALAVLAPAAAPAAAAAGKGTAAILLAAHGKGRTLSGQGVAVVADAPASRQDRMLSLPISAVDPGSPASATVDGSLRFKHGKRAVGLSELRLDLSAGTLTGKLGGETMPVFWLGATPSVNGDSGSVSLDKGKLLLTGQAAKALKEKLGLDRALVRKGVGTAWLDARANPTRAAAQPVSGGVADWGVLGSWRSYVLGQQGPPPPSVIGAIEVEDGATANGTLSDESGAFFGFPASNGSFERGLYGAGDRLALKTQGTVRFEKPMHCIVEVQLSALEVTLDGANSSLRLDSRYDVDVPNKVTHSCDPAPAVTTDDVEFAKLDLAGIVPVYSADGKTVTWSAIPATLTAAGASAFGTGYPAGQPLDPVTITVGLG